MSVLSRLQSMGEDGTELNLDGISKPNLNEIKSKADTITELSMNLCKLSSLTDLPKMPSLYKLHLNDNNLTDISDIVAKCPSLLELSLSGNKKIAKVDQLASVADFKTLMRLDLEGCAVANNDSYRKELFSLCSTLACIDNLDSRGNEVPDDDDEDEEEDGELSASDEEEKQPGLSALYGGELPSEDDDDDYNSNEEPEGSDGEDDSDHGEPEQRADAYNDEGAGPSSSGFMEWEPQMEFQGRQQLADALDLSSRLAQKEHQQKESSLFNALCDQSRFKTGEEEKEKDREDDWRQFLRRDVPLTDPYFPKGVQSSTVCQPSANYWSKWSTRTSTSGCASLTSSDIHISDIPELAWDASSFSESYDCSDSFVGSLLDCNSITTHHDWLDTHSENDFASQRNKQRNQQPKGRYASLDAFSDIIPRSSRTTSSLPFSHPVSRPSSNRIRHRTVHGTQPNYICPSVSGEVIVTDVIPEYSELQVTESWSKWTDGERKNYIEQLVQRLAISDQLEIIRIIDPATDIEALKSRNNQVLIPVHAIDECKFNKVQQYVAQIAVNQSINHQEVPINGLSPPALQTHQLRRSNSDPNLADAATTNAANRQKERESKLRQRRIFRWLNSQNKSQLTRRKRQLLRERQSGLFLQQEVVEVQNNETIDEQNEEIDVCE